MTSVYHNSDSSEKFRVDSSGNIGIGKENLENAIVFNATSTNNDTQEMLRVSKDGFYVRGEKVLCDENEAITVYEAFKNFLTWSALVR